MQHHPRQTSHRYSIQHLRRYATTGICYYIRHSFRSSHHTPIWQHITHIRRRFYRTHRYPDAEGTEGRELHTVLTVATSPISRGSITLNSSDIFAYLVINPNHLTSKFDKYAAVQALGDIFAFHGNKAFADYVSEAHRNACKLDD
jgi:hypothetical protein